MQRTIETAEMVRDPGFEFRRHLQAARDAREDQLKVPCAEASADVAEVLGGGVLPHVGEHLLAVVDHLAEEAEQAAAACGYGGEVPDPGADQGDGMGQRCGAGPSRTEQEHTLVILSRYFFLVVHWGIRGAAFWGPIGPSVFGLSGP